MDTAACANKLSLFVDMDVAWIESLKDMPLRSEDIWVVCYPKSGTQRTSQIVRLILNKGQDNEGTLSDAVPWVEAFTEEYHVNINENHLLGHSGVTSFMSKCLVAHQIRHLANTSMLHITPKMSLCRLSFIERGSNPLKS